MGKVTKKQGMKTVPESGWLLDNNMDVALYLVPLFQDRCYRMASELGSCPWSICSLDNGAFFLMPYIEEDEEAFFIKTDFYYCYISREGLGIAATLYACTMLSHSEGNELSGVFTSLYNSLREYAEDREDASNILAAAV